jgi:hypothetical protein
VSNVELFGFVAIHIASSTFFGRAVVSRLALAIPHGVPPLPIWAFKSGARNPRRAFGFPRFPEAASDSPGVALVFHWRALGFPGGIPAILFTRRHPARRSEFLGRGLLSSLRVKRVACHGLILVGKWLPNDSFKPNPLRGFGRNFKHSHLPHFTIRGGSA